MVLGRISRARRIQEVCIFCALRTEANLSRTSRRLHSGQSNRKAAEATAAQDTEGSDAPDLFPTRYSNSIGTSKSATSSDRKHDENSLYGARYTGRETPSWKRQGAARMKDKLSKPDPVTTQNSSQVLPLHPSHGVESYPSRNNKKRSTAEARVDTSQSQVPGAFRIQRVFTFGQQDERPGAPNNGTARISESRFQHPTSTKEDTTLSDKSGRSIKESLPASGPQSRQGDLKWTQLAPRKVAVPMSSDPQGAVPRFTPLERSSPPRPRRTVRYTNEENTKVAITPDSLDAALPTDRLLPESGRSEFVGFQSSREAGQDYTPNPPKPEPSLAPKIAIQSSPQEPETPSRFKDRQRNISWDEEDDVRGTGKRFKAKKSKAVRKRNDDKDEDDIDPEKLDKIEERQRRKAAAKVAREDRASGQSFIVPSFISIGNLATALKIRAESFGKVLRRQGFEQLSNDHVLDAETAGLIATELGFKAVLPVKDSEIDLTAQPAPESTDLLPPRPPVVTIMGHVDHGKTTLLDWLRNSSIAASEHGGITQHIGAFTVQMPSGRIITFLDTPGHAAFLEMRARGANVTDIVILVVAADDSVKPQTVEAIRHAKAAHTQIVVAISKIDKPEADIDRVKQDLARHGIEVEDYGGDTQTVCVSGKTGQGMDQLEDAIIALADVLDVKADPSGSVEGWVLEGARKSSGKTATVLVRRGTMRAGQIIVAGNTWARIRNLRNEAGVNIEEGLPGTPVEIDGWHEQPEAGAEVLQAPNEQRARRVVDYRIGKAEIEKQAAEVVAENEARRLHDEQRVVEKDRIALLGKRAARLQATPEPVRSGLTEVPIVIRADVSGSTEAINDSILALGNSEVRAKVIRSMVGQVAESDIELAQAAQGYIVNFNLELENEILRMAERAGVRIVDGSIIYKVMDDVKAVLEEKLPPRLTQHVTGEADVMQTFEINLKGKKTLPVAGCRVKNGLITKGSQVKVIREGDIIYDGLLSTLKNVKKDVTEMRKGSECGISFDNFSDFAPGDQIQCYEVKSEKRHL